MGKENLFFCNHSEQSKQDSLQNEPITLAPKEIEELKKWADPKSADFWVKIESALALSSLFLSSCAPVAKEKNPDPMLNTSTPNRLVLTETPTKPPLPTETPTEVPTPTEVLINEYELEPKFVKEINTEYKGVKIKSKIAIDSSMNSINSINVEDRMFADYLINTVYGVWSGQQLKNGNKEVLSLDAYINLWSKAQNSHDPADWEKVQISMWANDLSDGLGYEQQEYTVWPMSDEKPFENTFSMSAMDFVFVRGSMVDNITLNMNESSSTYGVGWSVNIDPDSGRVIYYMSATFNSNYALMSHLSGVRSFILNNAGGNFRTINMGSFENKMIKILEGGGFLATK